MTILGQVSLLMPTCQKWSDKAKLIRYYFQRIHSIDVTIVNEPPHDNSILIALEKENLVSVVEHLRNDICNVRTLVLKDPSLYMEMDDKSQDAWRQFSSSGVGFHEIRTINMMTATEAEVRTFINELAGVQSLMLKPSDEAASIGQAIVSIENIPEILSYMGRAYVAQPFFTAHKILTIDFLAIGGELSGHHCFYVDGPIDNSHWKTGLYQQVRSNATPEIDLEFQKIVDLTRRLCKKHQLDGIFEMEFLYDYRHSFFLELNLLPGLYGIDQNGLMPVLENVVVPYLQHFHVDIQPRRDFQYMLQGQFYPPSAKSLEYYLNTYGELSDDDTKLVTPSMHVHVAVKTCRPSVACSDASSENDNETGTICSFQADDTESMSENNSMQASVDDDDSMRASQGSAREHSFDVDFEQQDPTE